MFEKVLVLTDGDDPRQPALRRALECVAEGGEIEIFAIVYEPMLEGYLGNKEIYEPLRRRVLDERRERAAALARAVESEGVRSSAKAVWSHPMHAAVAAEVDAGGVDLVVAAVDRFVTQAKPAALDRDILRVASDVQRRTHATLSAVHCYVPLEYFGADLNRVAPSDPRLVDARLEAVRSLCTEAGVPADAARLVAGAPHSVLADLQQRGEADLVVMGALARGRFAELVLGNTAERLLHHGSGDVLVLTPRDHGPGEKSRA